MWLTCHKSTNSNGVLSLDFNLDDQSANSKPKPNE